MHILHFIFVVCVVLASAQTPPIFPPQYQLDFSETAKIGPLGGNTTGTIYVDEQSNQQLITRVNGHHDRYCGTVYKFSDTPCNHYITQGKRYLDFPDKKYCCYCCDSAHGCGIVASDWLVKANATYQGTEKLEDNKTYVKWEVKGGQSNFYYHYDDDKKTPRRLNQVPDDLMDYTVYRIGITDPSVFTLPSYCKDTCGITTICALLRGDKQLKSE